MNTPEERMRGVLSHHRLSAVLLLAVAACLAGTAEARAQAVGTATPDVAGGKGTRVAWSVDGLAPPVSARIPRSLALSAPGFKLDRRAVRRRCSQQQAELDECPRRSQVGTGALTIIVHRPAGINEVTFDIRLYHGPQQRVLAVTEFIGIRVIPGRLERVDGALQLSFDPLPTPPEIPGVQISYEFKGVSAELGASRKVKKRVGGRRRTVRYNVVRTPPECPAGSWATTATLGFPDGAILPLPAPMTCRGS
jgi:hypothetical protein